jgi:CheY-like chemotaxis protein
MPGKDGIEVFTELRRHPELKELPICIVTGKPEMRKLIYDRPVPPPEGFISKPVEEEALVLALRKILETKGQRDRPGKGR